jgi:hypothetical protein
MNDVQKPIELVSCPVVMEGLCVMIREGELLYAGPIPGCPKDRRGVQILLSPADYDDFEQFSLRLQKERAGGLQ